MTIDDKDEMATAMRKVLSELNLPINKKTKEFVYAFITENGGIEKLSACRSKIGQSQHS